jgi:hypothetical protein
MTKKLLAGLGVVALLAGLAAAGTGEENLIRLKDSSDVVTASAEPGELTAGHGDTVAFRVNLRIAKAWHVYAHEDTSFIGIDLQPGEGFPLANFAVSYPAGREGTFFDEKVVILEGPQSVAATATVPAELAAGEYALDLALKVQACDTKTCLRPADIPVQLKLRVN